MIEIGKHIIGDGEPTYIVAEAGVNHNCNLERAKDLVIQAANACADAIKFQTYKAEKLVTKDAPRFWSWVGEDTPDGTQYDSYSQLDKLPQDAYYEIAETCRKHDIEFLSTPFDEESADFLIEEIGMKAIKVSSSDITNLPFLKYMAKKQVPMMVSTGAATLGEIEEAVNTIRDEGNERIILLHCTLCYPTKPEDANLRIIGTLKTVFPRYPIGLSDHTIGITVPIAAVALGAKVIEKHYTIDKTLLKSADHWLSVDARELKDMVINIRIVEQALGSTEKKIFHVEEATYKYDKRSIVAAQDIPAGVVIREDMLIMKRPGTGLPPKYIDIIVGRKALNNIKKDTLLSWEDI
jgi:N,N'-diacetyllegionaminate synthase